MKSQLKYALLLVIIAISAVFLLNGCVSKTKSEKEIIADLQESPYFFPEQEIQIKDYEIIKRQTDKKNKSDIIYLKVFAENDNIACDLSYSMTYTLYSEGWVLDDVSSYGILDWVITPLRGVDDSTIQSVIDSYINDGTYDSLEITNRDTELGPNQGTDTVYFEATKEHLYATEVIKLSKTWYFESGHLYAFESPNDIVEDRRYLFLNDNFAGTEYTNLLRHYNSTSIFEDRFDIFITGLNSEHSINVEIYQKQVRVLHLNEAPQTVASASGTLSTLAYNHESGNWGICLKALDGVFYSSDNNNNFDAGDYFYFDLDTPGRGGITHWHNIEPIDYASYELGKSVAEMLKEIAEPST